MALQPNNGNLSDYLSEQNELIQNSVEFFSNVALGNRTNIINFKKQGNNQAVGTTQVVLNNTGSTSLDLMSNATISFVSSSADDAAAGTGARAIQIYGIDSTGAEQIETLVLNGTTPVNTVNTYSKILNRVLVVSAGSGQTNAGTITGTAAGKNVCSIAAGGSLMRQLAYCVPTNKKALYYSHFIDASKASGGGASKLEFFLTTLRNGVKYILFRFTIDLTSGQDVFLHRAFHSPMPFVAGDIWWFETKTNSGTAWIDAEVEQIVYDI